MFCQQVCASALGELIGGGIVALAIGACVAFYVGERLGLRQWTKDQKERKRKDAETALRYIQLLEEEIAGLAKWIPGQRERMREPDSRNLVNITLPVWQALRAAGDLARLVDPDLLTDTAHFYDLLAFAKQRIDLMVQTWLLDDRAVAHAPLLRSDLKESAERSMGEAQKRARPLLKLYEGEKERLGGLVAGATNGDAAATLRH